MFAVIGGVLIFLSGSYAALATILGTCTMGSADELLLGGLVSGVGYVLGIGFLIARPPTPLGWSLLAPAILAVLYQTYLAVGFFVAYHFQSQSACAWKEGIPEFTADGREPFLTTLWIVVSVIGIAGLAYA